MGPCVPGHISADVEGLPAADTASGGPACVCRAVAAGSSTVLPPAPALPHSLGMTVFALWGAVQILVTALNI